MMETIFLNAAGTTLFVRDDMEQGNWTQEEYTVNATFPFVSGKVIERGQRFAFRDTATDTLEMFEIRNVTNIEPEHYQQFIAEHIVVSELSDEHINTTEITDKTAAQALGTALTGTLWSVGTSTVSATNSVDIARGSVWQAVKAIEQNWNAYITPRVTLSAAGAITGRYLDISPAQGTFRGVRLSVDKNMNDSSVIIDDSEVLTALYGYGGNVDKPQATGDDKTEELTFKDVVWTATSSHPAKPANQTYLEDPAKTALYGRNGRARFGYYQNADIKDAEVLLQKTWEALQNTSDPKINITGTVTDLYRLGYKDQPLKLHDTVIVEIRQTGELFNLEIIKLDVDLIDPTATRPEIGSYIPNIIYINRDTDEKASGGGGGGGGGRGKTELEDDISRFASDWIKTDRQIGMVVGIKNGDAYIKSAQIVLAINDDESTEAYINADHVNISATSTAHLLAGSLVYDENGNLVLKESSAGGVYVEHNDHGTTAQFGVWDKGNLTGLTISQLVNDETEAYLNADHINISATDTVATLAGDLEHDANGKLIIKSAGGMYVQRTDQGITSQFGIWDKGNLTGGVMVEQINGQQGTKLTLQADVIDINGIVNALEALTVTVSYLNVTNGLDCGDVQCGYIDSDGIGTNTGNVNCGGTVDTVELKVDDKSATWQTYTARFCSLSNEHSYLFGDANLTPTGRTTGRVVIGYTDTTIHYLGY